MLNIAYEDKKGSPTRLSQKYVYTVIASPPAADNEAIFAAFQIASPTGRNDFFESFDKI